MGSIRQFSVGSASDTQVIYCEGAGVETGVSSGGVCVCMCVGAHMVSLTSLLSECFDHDELLVQYPRAVRRYAKALLSPCFKPRLIFFAFDIVSYFMCDVVP